MADLFAISNIRHGERAEGGKITRRDFDYGDKVTGPKDFLQGLIELGVVSTTDPLSEIYAEDVAAAVAELEAKDARIAELEAQLAEASKAK